MSSEKLSGWHKAVAMTLIAYFTIAAIGSCTPRDDTDPPDSRSGMRLYRDAMTAANTCRPACSAALRHDSISTAGTSAGPAHRPERSSTASSKKPRSGGAFSFQGLTTARPSVAGHTDARCYVSATAKTNPAVSYGP
jgi:hypothetical protein